MMIRGVTISIKLVVTRADADVAEQTIEQGSLGENRNAILRPCSFIVLSPPSKTVPPSGTVTVVVRRRLVVLGS